MGKAIDWRAEQQKEKEEKKEIEYAESNALNLNTSIRGSWTTPLIMAINLTPPSKTPQITKEERRQKRREQRQLKQRQQQMKITHGANIGHFVGSSFDQRINMD